MVIDYEEGKVMFTDNPDVWHELPTTKKGLMMVPLTKEACDRHNMTTPPPPKPTATRNRKNRRRKKLLVALTLTAANVRTQVCHLGPLENSARSSKKGATLLPSLQNHLLLPKAVGW